MRHIRLAVRRVWARLAETSDERDAGWESCGAMRWHPGRPVRLDVAGRSHP